MRSETFKAPDGTELAFYGAGSGPDVVLVHGFCISSLTCFGDATEWIARSMFATGEPPGPPMAQTLIDAGARVTMLDVRGHGGSAASACNGISTLTGDIRALFDHLGIESADIVGYSMGAVIVAHVLGVEDRLRSAVLGGMGSYILEGRDSLLDARVPAAFETGAWTDLPVMDAYISLATMDERTDLATLGRVYRALLEDVSLAQLSRVGIPVLVLASAEDESAADPDVLAAAIPGAEVALGSGNHVSALRDPELQGHLVSFLTRQWATSRA